MLAEEQIANGLASNDRTYWALADHLGTVRDVINNAAVLKNHLTYDAFGKITAESATSIDFLYGFTGLLRDEATGLYLSQTRWLDPATGKWMQEDWIGFDGGDANLTRYVGNAPTLYVDPTGTTVLGNPGNVFDFGKWAEKFKEIFEFIKKEGKGLTPEMRGLLLDIGQLALDIIGIFEPTPIADGLNTLISLGRQDWWGAGFSALGMIPYVGDFGKLGKLPAYVQKLKKAIDLARKSEKFAELLRPLMKHLDDLLKNLPLDKLPDGCDDAAKKALDEIRKLIDQFGRRYEPNPKHGKKGRGSSKGPVSPEPTNPQKALDESIPIKDTSTARVAVDPETGEYIVFRETEPGVFHGYAVPWNKLTAEQQKALIDAGKVTRKGKIIE